MVFEAKHSPADIVSGSAVLDIGRLRVPAVPRIHGVYALTGPNPDGTGRPAPRGGTYK